MYTFVRFIHCIISALYINKYVYTLFIIRLRIAIGRYSEMYTYTFTV